MQCFRLLYGLLKRSIWLQMLKSRESDSFVFFQAIAWIIVAEKIKMYAGVIVFKPLL